LSTPNQSATFSDIAEAIVAQIVLVSGLDPAYVNIVATDNYKIADFDSQFIYVRAYGIQPWTDYGAGRRVRRCKRFIKVFIHTRNNSDRYGDDSIAALAHFALEESVMDGLDEFVPEDEDGVALVVEPLHPLDDTSGPSREDIDDQGIVTSALSFEVQYVLRNNTPQP
jgi:hypothetical protein